MLKQISKNILPPVLFRLIKARIKPYGYFGDYKDWSAAAQETSGYDADGILEKVKASLLKVKNGEAVYERDSVLFDEVQYAWPMLACLLWIASQEQNQLRLVDFGGSLGSSYFQNIDFLKTLDHMSWSIVEQENFVQAGKEHFRNEHLDFFEDLEECITQKQPNAILLSSVAQYIESPYELFEKIKTFKYIIFDRTTFLRADEPDRITIQKVPKHIYSASYPCWFFNEKKFLNFFAEEYTMVAPFDSLGGSIDEHGIQGSNKGFLFKRKNIT